MEGELRGCFGKVELTSTLSSLLLYLLLSRPPPVSNAIIHSCSIPPRPTLLSGLSIHPTAHNQLVELKNGETFNGHLAACDNFMNLILREVFQTSSDGERFWKMKECYIRGNTVRFLPFLFMASCLLCRAWSRFRLAVTPRYSKPHQN